MGEKKEENFLLIYDIFYGFHTKNIVIQIELNGISISSN